MWFQESENPSMSRIDRVLVSVVWKDHFLDVTQRPLLVWYQIIVLFLWRLVVCQGGRVPLNLNICGLKYRVLWIKFGVGGMDIILWGPLV